MEEEVNSDGRSRNKDWQNFLEEIPRTEQTAGEKNKKGVRRIFFLNRRVLAWFDGRKPSTLHQHTTSSSARRKPDAAATISTPRFYIPTILSTTLRPRHSGGGKHIGLAVLVVGYGSGWHHQLVDC